MKTAAHLSPSVFSPSRQERVTLARERFFENGERPSGLVPEAVIQSWSRMWNTRKRTTTALAFNTVSASRLHNVLARSEELLAAARSDICGLEAMLSGTGCRVLLTDAYGVIVHATADTLARRSPVLDLVARVGVNISEDSVGTSAPAIAVKMAHPVVVSGAEHFYDCMHSLRCAAVPIRNTRGQLAGVLDLTMEDGHFPFDAAAMASLYATSIENRLLQAQAHDQVIVQLQPNASMLGAPLVGLVGVCSKGQVVWMNAAGAGLLGRVAPPLQAGPLPAQEVLGCTLEYLLAGVRCNAPQPHRLPSGLGVWMSVRAPLNDRRVHALATSTSALAATEPVANATDTSAPDSAHVVPALPPATLSSISRQFIEQAVRQAGGNLSRAARQLGVSRGLLYRKLAREQLHCAPPLAPPDHTDD